MSDNRVEVVTDGESATVTIAGQAMKVPIGQLRLDGGRLWVDVPATTSLNLDASEVSVIAWHPEPTLRDMVDQIDKLDPNYVSALMNDELRVGGMDDPMGLFAIRAVTRALAGDPVDGPGPDDDPRGL